MSKCKVHKGSWVDHALGNSVAVSVNDLFTGSCLVNEANANSVGGPQVGQRFTPPPGPKHLPLSQCPNLESLLLNRDKAYLDKVADELLGQQHDAGFIVTLEPGQRKEVREIYGAEHETFTSWHIEVRRSWTATNGNSKSSVSDYTLRFEDNRTLAAALYLAERIGANINKLHLFKPFRPPSYVEAWLAEQRNANPKLSARANEVGGKVYLYTDGPLATSGGKVVSLFVGMEEYSLSSWGDLIRKTCDILNDRDAVQFRSVAQRCGDKFLSDSPDLMREPRIHKASGLYLEMHLPPYSMMRHSRILFEKMGYRLRDIGLVYLSKGSDAYGSERKQSLRVEFGPKTEYDANIEKLLSERFTNGVRPGSCIDQNKIRRVYREVFGSDLPDDFDIEKNLPRLGMINEGKVFPYPDLDEAGWRKTIDEQVGNGFGIFGFSRIMELHAVEMMAAGVTSYEMLKKLICQYAGNEFKIGKKYFACQDWPLKIADAVWKLIPESVIVVSEKGLCRQLLYVDPADIHALLASDGRYIWNSPDSYVIPERVVFDEQEVERSLVLVRKSIKEKGYFSLSQLEFVDSAALNDSCLTAYAFRKVFFNRFLVSKYVIRGQIVCYPDAEIDGRMPLRDYFRTRSDLSLEQILAVAKEFNILNDMAMLAAHEELVRVDYDMFVSPRMVTFDVDAIDVELERHCSAKVTTLGSLEDLSDLSALPGYAWNRYLLESYLRRESKRFALVTPSLASREVAGAVVRRNSGISDAVEAFAEVAVASGVVADEHEVGEFLIATRCVLRRGATLIAQVISKMRDIYERNR